MACSRRTASSCSWSACALSVWHAAAIFELLPERRFAVCPVSSAELSLGCLEVGLRTSGVLVITFILRTCIPLREWSEKTAAGPGPVQVFGAAERCEHRRYEL